MEVGLQLPSYFSSPSQYRSAHPHPPPSPPLFAHLPSPIPCLQIRRRGGREAVRWSETVHQRAAASFLGRDRHQWWRGGKPVKLGARRSTPTSASKPDPDGLRDLSFILRRISVAAASDDSSRLNHDSRGGGGSSLDNNSLRLASTPL